MLSQGPQTSLSAPTEALGLPGMQPKATHSALTDGGPQSGQANALSPLEGPLEGASGAWKECASWSDRSGGRLPDPPLLSCVSLSK